MQTQFATRHSFAFFGPGPGAHVPRPGATQHAGCLPGVYRLLDKPVVRPVPHELPAVLRPAGAQCAPVASASGGDAGGDCPPSRTTVKSRCFAGAEGHGCPLSPSERAVLNRVRGEPMSWEA